MFNFCLHSGKCFPSNAKNAFEHYKQGSGEALRMYIYEIDLSGVGPTYFYDVRDLLDFGRQGEYDIDARQAYSTTGEAANYLGDITLRLQGTLAISSSGVWSFNGVLKSYDDFYDFNISTHRDFWGELITAYGRNTPGKDYRIEIRGLNVIRESGR